MRHDGSMRVQARQGVRLSAVLLGAVAVLLAIAPQATAVTITAADRCCTFVGGPFEQPRGESARFLNPSSAGAWHNVEAVDRGPGGRRLFFSETIQPGNEVPVAGTEYLDSGVYPFVCSLHPGMDGTLSVSTSGTPVLRPVVRSLIPAQSLRQVARKRLVKISVTSPTGATGVSLQVRVGKIRAGAARSINLGSNQPRVLAVRLSAKGVRAVKAKRSVALQVTASVPFGSPSSARRVIR